MAELFENVNKYRLIIIGIVISFVIVVCGSIIIGNFGKEEPVIDAAIVISEGDLAINYIDGDVVSIKNKDEYTYNVSITNTSVDKMYYAFDLVDVVNDDYMHVSIYEESGEEIYSSDDASKNIESLDLVRIEGGQTIRYKIIFKQSKKEKFSCRLLVSNESLTTQTFADLILLNNVISLPKTNVGEQVSTLKEGLISSDDNFGTTYYFRGLTLNNYVKIGNSYFRIVRINGNGTVRLVLDDVIPVKYKYNVNPSNDGIVGNMAYLGNASLVNDLNSWLETNYSEYMEAFAYDYFCTDLVYDNHSNGLHYTNTYTRIFYNEPTLKCSGASFQNRIGLLSIDEIMYAGATRGESNKMFYLYNSNIEESYLTNSAFYINNMNEVFMMNVSSTGKLGEGVNINAESYVRPVVNLSASAKVKGTGTYDDPYVLVV